MIDQSVHNDFLPAQIYRVLCSENSGTHIEAQMDIALNEIAFHIVVNGDSAVVSFDSFSDALQLCKMFAGLLSEAKDKRGIYNSILSNLNTTIYLQNRHFGIAGPNAKPLTSKFFKMLTYLLGRI